MALPPGQNSVNAMRQAMESLSPEKGPKMLSWLHESKEALGDKFYSECLTALVQGWGKHDYDEVIDHLMEVEGMTSEDKYQSIVRSFPLQLRDDPEALVAFVESIPDVEVRELLKSEVGLWEGPLTRSLEQNPDEAIAEIFSRGDLTDSDRRRRDRALFESFQMATNRDFILDAIKASEVIEDKEALFEGIFMEWMTADINNALRSLASLKEPEVMDSVISKRWKSIAHYDAVSAIAWIETIENDELREETMRQYENAYKEVP